MGEETSDLRPLAPNGFTPLERKFLWKFPLCPRTQTSLPMGQAHGGGDLRPLSSTKKPLDLKALSEML